MCKVRLYGSAVGVLKVSYCGQCPAHSTEYKKERIGDSFPPKFTTVIDYHKCTKTGRRVSYTELSEGCPLPGYETPAAGENEGKLQDEASTIVNTTKLQDAASTKDEQ